MNPKIIIHGGFFSESKTNKEIKIAKQKALTDIVKKSFRYLLNHSAAKTVVYSVELLENCPLFNAGTGSQIQSDGKIRMSASLMDGKTERFSGVINIRDIKNPIRLAEKLIDLEDRVLGGDEALAFARRCKIPYFNPEIPQRRIEFEEKMKRAKKGNGKGTVGCVALDKNGNIAAATSTGGKGFEVPGRVSDSATVAGNYANRCAGVSCTGVGEDIVNSALASKIVTRVSDGFSLKEAVDKSFAELKKNGGFAGIISIDNKGNFYHLDSHPYMVFALLDQSGIKVFE